MAGRFFCPLPSIEKGRGLIRVDVKTCLLTIRKPSKVADSQLSWRVFSSADNRFSLSRSTFFRLVFENLATFRQNVLAELLTLGSFVLFSPFSHLYSSYADH